ncbi:MAG TPA: Ig-like domain-containing protein [Candidatus Binatia bacterium]|nr:Ig-like domain-containing protein [Candidatus Binatia bacterium]
MLSVHRNRRLSACTLLLVGALLLGSFATSSTTSAQEGTADYWRYVRSIEAEQLGVDHPAELTYSPQANAFLIAESGASRIVMLTPTEDPAGTLEMGTTLKDALDLAFDGKANRLLAFDPATQELVEIKAKPSGVPDPMSIGRFDARALGLQNPRGLTVDPASGRLYLLDSGARRIVGVDPAPDQSLDIAEALRDGRVSSIDLQPAELVAARGLAFNPANGHLYLLSPAKHALYELTQTGQVVAVRDLSDSDDFKLIDPQGMVFAPSGDSTDDPSHQSLYIADSRLGDQWQRPGEIIELSLAETATSDPFAAASTIVPTLVRTIFTSQWSSPSPDPMGGAHIPTTNRLMISDSEIEEYQRPYWNGGNIFESTLQGNFLTLHNITSFTNEPTGIAFNPNDKHLFISDDNQKEVFEVDPGNDNQWFTGDDIRTHFDTKVLGTNDTEDVAYNPFNGYLYLADGVNSEVWEIRPGPNGRFDGVAPAGDDQASHWDTSSKGINDPEGITVNTDTGTLYVTGHGATTVIETTTGGTVLNVYNIQFIKNLYGRMQPSGLAYGPSSVNPAVNNLYITDRAVDNDADPRENDGKIHEITLGSSGDTAPTIISTAPAGGAANVALDANITVNFSESVNVSGAWFNISCATSGAHTATVSGGPQSFTLNPDADFAIGENCTVTIMASQVTDQDTNDPPDNMAANFSWSFTTSQPSPPPSTDSICLSLAASGAYTVGTLSGVHDEDIICFDGTNWTMLFDGSDVSVTGEVDAFTIVDSNTILFSLAAAAPVGSLGTVDDSDIVQFDGTLGPATAGTFSLFLDGPTVGLDTSGEDIDAIELLSDGRLLVSTVGSAGVVSGARDEDLLAFTPTTPGNYTSGTWAMYFDGSDVDLATASSEDVDAVDVAANGDIYLSTRGLFAVSGVSGDNEDVFVCTPTSLGLTTACTYSPTLYFDGSTWGLAGNDVDAINLP